MKLLFSRACLSWALAAQSAPFENLLFDEANTNSVQSTVGPGSTVQSVGLVSDLLPGWQLYHGSTEVTQIYFNTSPASSDAVSLDTDGEGRYRLEFFDTDVPFTLVQRGDIPADAWGLFFSDPGGQGIFNVSINGSLIISPGSPDGAYVAGWTGQNVELKLSTVLNTAPESRYFLDNIHFVPEPPPSLLVGIALICGAIWRGCWHRVRRLTSFVAPD